jgi:hypothetical protein
MTWTEVFAVLLVSHLVGDLLLQTEWQAINKYSGLSGGEPLRALLSHIATYTVAMVPALIWLLGSHSLGLTVAVAALIVLPHLAQDDGRLLIRYCAAVKHASLSPGDWLFTAVDQSFHVVALFGAALLAVSGS